MSLDALLVSSDRLTARVLGQALDAFGIGLEIYADVVEALSNAKARRFDVVFVDPDNITRAAPLLPVLREIATHRKQLIVSVLQPRSRQPESHSFGTDFVLWKPLSIGRVTQFLRAAFGLIVTEHVRYFRHRMEIPAAVGFGIETVPAIMADLSAGGMCLQWLRRTPPTGPLSIRFILPGQKITTGLDGELAWRGDGNRLGVRFTHVPEITQIQLERWLLDHMGEDFGVAVRPGGLLRGNRGRHQSAGF
jgi:hypothetical protein